MIDDQLLDGLFPDFTKKLVQDGPATMPTTSPRNSSAPSTTCPPLGYLGQVPSGRIRVVDYSQIRGDHHEKEHAR